MPSIGCERIIVHSGFDRDDVPNYTVHEIDPSRMVETGRTCVLLDSPGVTLEQVGKTFLFRASAPNTAIEHYRLTQDLLLAVAKEDELPTALTESLRKWNADDPRDTFGDLPGLFPISAAVQSRDGRFVFYSVRLDEHWMRFTRVVRYDTRSHRIDSHVDLSKVGCEDDPNEPQDTGRVHYLFVDQQGRLIAIAGSAVEYLDHDHVHW